MNPGARSGQYLAIHQSPKWDNGHGTHRASAPSTSISSVAISLAVSMNFQRKLSHRTAKASPLNTLAREKRSNDCFAEFTVKITVDVQRPAWTADTDNESRVLMLKRSRGAGGIVLEGSASVWHEVVDIDSRFHIMITPQSKVAADNVNNSRAWRMGRALGPVRQ